MSVLNADCFVGVEDVANVLRDAKKVVVLTGAGVSTDSGIPDFRSAGGFWVDDKGRSMGREEVASRSYYQRRPKDFWVKYKEIFYDKMTGSFEPNQNHELIVDLEQGRRVIVATQNVDGLHQRAGSSEVYEMHGSLRKAICPKCKTEYDVDFITSVEVPRCVRVNGKGVACNFILDVNVVLFGDRVRHFKEVVAELQDADVLLVMGTSLAVSPVNTLLSERGATTKVVILNREYTPDDDVDHYETYVVLGELSEIVADLRGRLV